MGQHLTILTGATRGLGAGLARQLLRESSTVLLCISRGANDALAAAAATSGAVLEQWTMDLAAPLAVATRLEAWLGAQDAAVFDSASLINNAAALTRIGPLDRIDADELSRALRVGLEAPLLLAGAFLRATAGWHAERKLLNVSSGLGRHAMASQAPYCAVKAGLDHASRALALDEATKPNGAKVVALAPGVIDTGMQTQLRGADADAFPDRALFVELERSGRLSSPDDAARQVLAYLARADFGSEVIADVREG
jgi:NAD(P)-dependent dehydrogenase (short-subunit alcohol dehydrogenase family)